MTATTTNSRLDWFAGDVDALDLYTRLVYVAHAWDDLIDKDKPVNVNLLMTEILLYLPANKCYQRFQHEIHALMWSGVAGYMAANIMEKSGDAHKIEIAHYLRYSVVGVVTFLITAINGLDRGAQIISMAIPEMIPERLDDYMKEHLHADPK